jgi:ZIP family zinc transporter
MALWLGGFGTFLLLVSVMGLSIFLSLPVILTKAARSRTVTFLNAAAIGILLFLLADIFGDIAPLIASSTAYLTLPSLDVVFVVSVAGVYAALYAIDQGSRPGLIRTTEGGGTSSSEKGRYDPQRLALLIAVGIGFQNLTEGLVFGSAWSQAAVGLVAVIFLGFFLQNVTEGFPIVSPYLGEASRPVAVLASFFLIGGIPTIIGGAVGYYYNSSFLDVLFDSLAIGAILYVLLPMLRVAFRPLDDAVAAHRRNRLVSFGLLVGFLIGFLVNAF